MKRAGEQEGLTLVEMLVSIAIGLLVFGTALTLLNVTLRDSRASQLRNEAQDGARTAIDRMSRELRTAVASSTGSALLEQATPYDMVFREVMPSNVTAANPSGQIRVRYCLDANNTLWRQTQTMQTATDALPDVGSCPSASWDPGPFVELGNCAAPPAPCTRITNEVGGDNRPLFTYGPVGWSDPSQIKLVEMSLYVDENQNPDTEPPATHLTSGIYLRNSLAAPLANFTWSKPVTSTTPIQLNASSSTDPNGQVLSYQWYNGGSCAAPSNPLPVGGTSQEPPPQGPFPTGTNETYVLVVTDTAGLSQCFAQTVTVS